MRVQSTPTIIWYQPQQSSRGVALQSRLEDLNTAGFEVQTYILPRDFYAAATKVLANSDVLAPLIFMVSGINSESLAAISRLRLQSVDIPILVEFPSFVEELVLHALYSGADDYCVLESTAALWVAKIESLLRRSRYHEVPLSNTMASETPKLIASKRPSQWSLTDEGWLLKSPEGLQMALTTTERQFLLALCAKPEEGASHQELLCAIDSFSSTSFDVSSGPNRLGVLISRLKRKANGAGFKLPIRSIYKWGYVFSAPIQVGNMTNSDLD